jgi:hypothetical protein
MATPMEKPGRVSNTSTPRSADSAAMKAGIIWHPPEHARGVLLASCAVRVGAATRHRITRMNAGRKTTATLHLRC